MPQPQQNLVTSIMNAGGQWAMYDHVKLYLHYGDLCNTTNVITIISNTKLIKILQTGVHVSHQGMVWYARIHRQLWLCGGAEDIGRHPFIKFYQATTSELHEKVQAVPQSKTTPFYPRSPYAGESIIYTFYLFLQFAPVMFILY